MNVFVACEFSGVVRDAFREAGHNAWSCDLKGIVPEGKYKNNHLYGNCLNYLAGGPDGPWDMMIAHPPCTYLANSGVRWMDEDRQAQMKKAAEFFMKLLAAPIPKIAVENPVMHKHAREFVTLAYDQKIGPWQFGHEESKGICLWLKNLPALIPTEICEHRTHNVHRMGTPKDRGRKRSRFYPGIAKAMVEQWG